MKIPVVMVSDDNFISQTRVTIWTMRKNTNKDTFLEITILCPSQLKEEAQHRICELEALCSNLKIVFYKVDSDILINAKPVSRIPITSFYRLIISEVLREEEKCLFLDGDLIVNTDLRNLYLQDMGDAYIAGVRDNMFWCAPDNAVRHFTLYGFEKFDSYINAGVMLLNLSEMRKDGIQEKLVKCMENHYPYMDQDILNKVCDGKIKLLDLKYNYFSWRKNEKVKTTNGEYDRKADKWEILHFVGSDKPWVNFRVRGGQEWWKYAKEALEEDVYEEMYKQAKKVSAESDWSYILNRCLKEKTIIIIGYSNIGTDVYCSLKRCNVSSDMFFCDNSKKKQCLGKDKFIVFPVEELAERYPNALWINTSQNSYEEINVQLENLGIQKEQIIVYRKKDEAYFEMLDDIYIDYELKQLRLKALGEV